MKTEGKRKVSREWVKFMPVDLRDGRKTKVWAVMTIDGTECLGRIGWYSPWRRYCFIIRLVNDECTQVIFEQDCLRRIADFVETETMSQSQRRRDSK